MHPYPHHYLVKATGEASGNVVVESPGLESLDTTPPPEFGGPEGYWSPETMLVGAISNCFILTFRGVTQASKFEWISLECEVDGILDRVERVTSFNDYNLKVRLTLPQGGDAAKAEKLLHKSEQVCLVTNSLVGKCHLDITIDYAG